MLPNDKVSSTTKVAVVGTAPTTALPNPRSERRLDAMMRRPLGENATRPA